MSTSASLVARRFWILLVTILGLTIWVSIVTLQSVAVPFLADYQNRMVQKQTKITAQHLDAWLSRRRLLLEFIANDPNVQNIALGYAENGTYFEELVASMPVTESLSWMSFYDGFGARVADYKLRGFEKIFFDPMALTGLLDEALNDAQSDRLRVVLVTSDDISHFVLAKPIYQNGFVEGVLLAGYRFDINDIFPASEITERAYLLPDSDIDSAPMGVTLAPLQDVELTVAFEPNVALLEATGSTLITRSAAAIAAVLIGAFSLFALLGRTAIVAPHRRLEEQAHDLETQKRELAELAAIAERANDAVILTDLFGRLKWANPSFERLTGYRNAEVIGRKPGALLQSADTDPLTIAKIKRALKARQAVQVELLNTTKDQKPYWISLSISPLRNSAGATYGFVGISNDITKARESREALLAAKQEIEHQARHDPLTGLPNRRALDDALRERVATQDANSTLVRIDLDHFKYVNDTMGHEAGDYVLTDVARILESETKSDDLAVRVGGDEFVLLLGPKSGVQEGKKLAQRILERIKVPKRFENKTIRVGASFGVATIGSDVTNHKDLIIAADAALYEAKEAGRNRVHLYTPELHNSVLSRRELARELRLAVARDEFEPHFQLQFDARSEHITGVETLARWRSEKFGLVSPARFLPVAKQLSIVEEIDDQIFRKSIQQIADLRDAGIAIPKLSVNVTAQRIQDKAVHDLVAALPANAPQIAFEVLESVLVEEQSAHFKFGLDLLRELGVRIEIDDFGSGHASIIGLMHLRPDAMKIDQRLVTPVLSDMLARGLLERIVSMAELMNLTVIAEGVETAEHARVLADIGCHILQGFHFCKPMAAPDLRAFMEARNKTAASNSA